MQQRTVTKVRIGLVDFFDRDFSDPKKIILPQSQFWFDRVEFHKSIDKRDAKLLKIRGLAEKTKQKGERDNSQKRINETVVESKSWHTTASRDKAAVMGDKDAVSVTGPTPKVVKKVVESADEY